MHTADYEAGGEVAFNPCTISGNIRSFTSSFIPMAHPDYESPMYQHGFKVSPAARTHRGFTLIELMVVVVIIGVLAALIVPNVLERADDARITAARTDVGNLVQQLKLYKLDNLRLPTAQQGLQALVTKPTTEPIPPNWKPYMDKLPNDPWGHPYVYLYPGVKGEFDVMSYGPTGKSGGEGKDAEIGSWQ